MRGRFKKQLIKCLQVYPNFTEWRLHGKLSYSLCLDPKKVEISTGHTYGCSRQMFSRWSHWRCELHPISPSSLGLCSLDLPCTPQILDFIFAPPGNPTLNTWPVLPLSCVFMVERSSLPSVPTDSTACSYFWRGRGTTSVLGSPLQSWGPSSSPFPFT